MKSRLQLLSIVNDVIQFGNKKHNDPEGVSWRKFPAVEHLAGCFRHVARYIKGERKDAESGYHPLAHAATRLLFIAWQDSKEEIQTIVEKANEQTNSE